MGWGIGFDFSQSLLEICRGRTESAGLEVVAADAVNLPCREGAFDAALSIAVLHHISSEVRSSASVSKSCLFLF